MSFDQGVDGASFDLAAELRGDAIFAVALPALLARAKRKLRREGRILHTNRGTQMRRDFGRWCVTDRNVIIESLHDELQLQSWSRREGILSHCEYLAAEAFV